MKVRAVGRRDVDREMARLENQMIQWGYVEGEGYLPIDRLGEESFSIYGLTKKERGRVTALIARRNWLLVKLQNMPKARWGYDGAELAALEWALETIRDHYELINTEDV